MKPYYVNISSEDLVAIKLISAINHTWNKPIGRAVALLRGRNTERIQRVVLVIIAAETWSATGK